MKRILLILLGAFIVLAAIVLVRGVIPTHPPVVGQVYPFEPDANAIARLMSEAVRHKTISFGRDKPTSAQELRAFHAFLQVKFPRVHRSLKREVVGGYSLLYTWHGTDEGRGTDEGSAAKPVVLLGHLDVVPIIAGTEDLWAHPPFAGVMADGFVWGRGTLDNKVNIIAILAAAEAMLESGLAPRRTIYFGFGHDEEQGGLDGARAIGALLEQRGVQAEFILDEGGLVVSDVMEGVDVPLAIIAPAEKGIVTLSLSAAGTGGHSSVPPEQTAIGIVAAAIARLEANQFPRDFVHVKSFLESVADELPLPSRLVMKNLWLFEPIVKYALRDDMQMQAAMRTTTAATIISGGVKANVLPIGAEAKVNFRILPGETPATVRARVIDVIGDARVKVAVDNGGQVGMAPSPVSPQAGFGWEVLTSAIRDIAAPERVVIAPRLLVAATDTRHYRAVSPNHYRFVYMRAASLAELSGIHGTNERIGISALKDTVRFYHRLMSAL